MKVQKIVISLPAIMGLVLLAVTYFDLNQFHSHSIEIRTMLGRELLFVGLGFVSAVILLIMNLKWLYKKSWANVILSVISVLVFCVCFFIGGVIGGAYLNAT
jgi:cell division protein FtsW (lipid II flippase)